MVKNSPANAGVVKRSLGQEDGFGGGNGNPLLYSCLENPMSGGDWWAAVHGVLKSQTPLKPEHVHKS